MKYLTKAIAVIMLIICSVVILSGCRNSSLMINTDYAEYYFDSSLNRYIMTGRKLRINENKTSFTMTFANDTSITGSLIIEDDINGLVLSVSSEAFQPFKTSYAAYLTEAYADTYSSETIQALLDQIKVMEQMYYNKKHIFSSRSIQLVKAITDKDVNVNYAIFEGLYDSVKDSDIQYLFRNGRLYTVTNGKTSDIAYGSYTINENYITVTRTDADGEPIYKEGALVQLSYLYTTISYPTDFTINVDVDDDDYNEMVESSAKLLAGKTVAVLVSTFYLAE
ncbi:MAG: hypothetical protein EOM87_03915 [Clostridia bacterium]|nr:hypothetical protein [Clostridia bacterium]